MEIKSEKYGELLQAIAELIATKNSKIDELHGDIEVLTRRLEEAEDKKGNEHGNTV